MQNLLNLELLFSCDLCKRFLFLVHVGTLYVALTRTMRRLPPVAVAAACRASGALGTLALESSGRSALLTALRLPDVFVLKDFKWGHCCLQLSRPGIAGMRRVALDAEISCGSGLPRS